jgi:hypothetical protein
LVCSLFSGFLLLPTRRTGKAWIDKERRTKNEELRTKNVRQNQPVKPDRSF